MKEHHWNTCKGLSPELYDFFIKSCNTQIYLWPPSLSKGYPSVLHPCWFRLFRGFRGFCATGIHCRIKSMQCYNTKTRLCVNEYRFGKPLISNLSLIFLFWSADNERICVVNTFPPLPLLGRVEVWCQFGWVSSMIIDLLTYNHGSRGLKEANELSFLGVNTALSIGALRPWGSWAWAPLGCVWTYDAFSV